MEQEYHEMVLEQTHPSGVEEWFCPMCGRRFLMQWPPAYKKVILEPGDEYAIHSGGKGAELNDGPDKVAQELPEMIEASGQTQEDQASLEPWIEWLDKVDFESWWQK